MRTSFRTDVFLKEDMVLKGYDLYPHLISQGVMRIEDPSDSNRLAIFGAPGELRRLAESLHQLADEVERTGNRQRTLDNAPAKSRTKFVLEGEATTDIKLAA
ncbi:hypothetical protein [Glycomyces sp. NPDC021274]|uniref:hypothetical protein n=1 Tax=Glycomyces sp. NPDC021274 TaxID=3155120 RepID=UPI0033C8E0B8